MLWEQNYPIHYTICGFVNFVRLVNYSLKSHDNRKSDYIAMGNINSPAVEQPKTNCW